MQIIKIHLPHNIRSWTSSIHTKLPSTIWPPKSFFIPISNDYNNRVQAFLKPSKSNQAMEQWLVYVARGVKIPMRGGAPHKREWGQMWDGMAAIYPQYPRDRHLSKREGERGRHLSRGTHLSPRVGHLLRGGRTSPLETPSNIWGLPHNSLLLSHKSPSSATYSQVPMKSSALETSQNMFSACLLDNRDADFFCLFSPFSSKIHFYKRISH